MKIKIFKTEKNFKKTNLFINPDTYWRFVLCLGFLLTLAAIFFGLYLFMVINQEPVLPTENTVSKATTVKKEKIDGVLQYFSERQKKSTRILNSPSPIPDPSR